MTDTAVEAQEAPAEAPKKAPKEPQPCECSIFVALTSDTEEDGEEFTTGCFGTETKAMFAPGHDAKLKSLLIRAGADNLEIRYAEGGLSVSSDAQTVADKYGFGSQVASGIAKLQGKRVAAEARLAERAKAAEAKEADKAAKKAARDEAKALRDAAKAEEKAAKAQKVEADPNLNVADSADEPILAEVDGQPRIGYVTESPEFGIRFTYEDENGISQTTGEFSRVEG